MDSWSFTKALLPVGDSLNWCSLGEDDRKLLFFHVDDVTPHILVDVQLGWSLCYLSEGTNVSLSPQNQLVSSSKTSV